MRAARRLGEALGAAERSGAVSRRASHAHANAPPPETVARQLSGAAAGPADAALDGEAPLYPGHVPLSRLQRGAVAVVSAVGALLQPARADLVAALGETTGRAALASLRDQMLASPSGAALLAERPRITDDTLAACWEMPPGSFGAEYAAFMGVRRFRPEERPAVRFVDDGELAYVATRARETHDLWHVLFGCDTSVLGEAALKAVEAVQTGLPMTALAVAGGALRLPPHKRALLTRVYVPWALRAGARAAPLICVRYEELLPQPLPAVRALLRITPAPQQQ